MLLCGAHRWWRQQSSVVHSKRAQEEKSWGSAERQAKRSPVMKGAWEIVAAGPCCSREKTDTHSTATFECASALLLLLPGWPPLHQCKSPPISSDSYYLYYLAVWCSPHRCRPISVVSRGEGRRSRVGVISSFEKWFEWGKMTKEPRSLFKLGQIYSSLLFLSCSMLLWWPGI